MRRLVIAILFSLTVLNGLARRSKSAQSDDVPDVPHPMLSPQEQAAFDSLYFRGLARLQADSLDAAFALLTKALAVDNTSAAAMYATSTCLARSQNISAALQMAHNAAEADTTNYWYSAREAQLLRYIGDDRSAIPLYERLARHYPHKSEPLYELVSLYYSQDSLEQCLASLDKLEDVVGVSPEIISLRFQILEQRGQLDEAFAGFDRLIARHPYDIRHRLTKGNMQMSHGRLSEAKQTYDEAARIDPDNAYLWVAMSGYYSVMGQQAEADSLVEAALVNARLDVDTKVDILTDYLKTLLRRVAHERSDRSDTSAITLPSVDTLFATIIAMHPTEPAVYSLYSDYLSAIGSDSLATVQMRYAVDLRPTDAAFWSKYISLASSASDPRLLLRLCDEAERNLPTAYEPHLFRAYAMVGDKEQPDYIGGINEFRRARALVPTDETNRISSILASIGDTYHQAATATRGTTQASAYMDSAYVAYDEALTYNPNNIMVLNNYAYFLSLEKRDLMKAESMAARVVKQQPDVAIYLDTYAWIYFQQGNYTLARFYQEQAINKSDQTPSAELIEHYGDILMQCGDADRAAEQWQRALSVSDCESADILNRKIQEKRYIPDDVDWK